MEMFSLLIFLPLLGFVPYFAQRLTGRSGAVHLEIRAVYWRLKVHKRPNNQRDWTLHFPLFKNAKDE